MIWSMAGFSRGTLLVWLIAVTLSQGASAQRLVLDDPLTNSTTSGTRGGSGPGIVGTGGVFIPGQGWKCTGVEDCIYWHLDCPVSKGRVEFYVTGLKPNSGPLTSENWEWYPQYCRWDKSELFHMYDNSYENADNNYSGYRNNKFKMYIRKIGPWDRSAPDAKNGRMELVWQIRPDGQEPDSQILSWSTSENYKFQIDWGPDGKGQTFETIKRYKSSDGYTNPDVISTSPSLWAGGYWYPGEGSYSDAHSIRIGASTRRENYDCPDGSKPDFGAPDGAIYSNVKVWQYVPIAPVVTLPIKRATYSALSQTVAWAGEPHTAYEVHVTSANDPNTGIVWDSGQVTSTASQVTTGTLANLTNYYVFVRIANQAGWGDWSAGGYWFRTDTSYVWPRSGAVSVSGNCLQDSGGPFLGLGATYMRGMQQCKYDRSHYERDLSCLAANGFNYIRILTMVGWDGLEIAPLDIDKGGWWVYAWPDYDQQLKDTVDIAYDKYRIRTEITIFADAQNCMPNGSDRYAHMDRILADIAGREHKVILIEVCNEYFQNGLTLDEVRTYGAYLAARTSIPIALSSPGGDTCTDACDMYCSSAADIATIHFSRDVTTFEEGWLPVRDPWETTLCTGLPPISSNEPCGPGYLTPSEDVKVTTISMSSAASFAWVAKLPMYVYHCRPGVDGRIRPGYPYAGDPICFVESRGVDSYQYLTDIMPSDLPNWARNDGIESSAPFTVYCSGVPNKYWTDAGYEGATTGCHRNIGGIKGRQFVCYPQGIRSGGVTLQARRDMSLTVYNPLTGAVVDTRTLTSGQNLNLAQGPEAYIIKGSFTGTDTTIPGPVIKFAANPADAENVLTWQNPSDVDFWGTKVLYRTDRYPTSPTDGALACDRVGVANAKDQYTHTGLGNGTRYYYAAFAYDDNSTPGPNYSIASTAIGTPVSGQCFSEKFTYPDGDLNGNRSWSGSASLEIEIVSDSVKINGGSDTRDALHSVSCSGSGGIIHAHVRVKAGAGESTLWGFWVDDPGGNNLARWYGTGVTARPRIGDTGIVLPSVNLTGGWDELRVLINTTANTSQFFFNGISQGTLDHSSTGAGDTVGRVKLDRVYNSPTGDYVYLNNVVIGPTSLEITPPGPVTNFVATNQESQVDLSWTNPTDPDYAGTKIVYKTSGYPTDPSDGWQVYDGTGTSCIHTDPPGGTIYYAAYAYDGVMNYSAAATASVTRPAQPCLTEPFSYSNGNLNGNGGWAGSATTQIVVEDQSVKFIGGSTSYDAIRTLSPPCAGDGTAAGVALKIKRGTGTSTMWSVWIDDVSNNNLARWYGTGTSARGRIGTSGTLVTSPQTLTDGWDGLYVKINFPTNESTFFFNSVNIGTLNHSETGAGDSIGRIRFERIDYAPASGNYMYLDDLVVGPVDSTAPGCSVASPSVVVTRSCPIEFAVNFSEVVYGFNSSIDVQVNSTGGAGAGSVSVTGSGAGPYAVTLSSLSGGGTLGITVKAASCADMAGNANSASAASATCKVLASDGSISSIESLSDDAPVELGNKALYLKEPSFAYIEEPDRLAGMRLQGALAGSEGDNVCLTGAMKTTAGGERYVLVDAMSPCGTLSIDPFGSSNSGLLDDILTGMYVKCWGKVKPGSITGNSYVLTDGSDSAGIKVITPGAPGVVENEFVIVEGAAGYDGARVVYEK